MLICLKGELRDGCVLFVIASPENLRDLSLRRYISKLDVVNISVDEGHCITECKLYKN
jgi:superfamily II DNA helicase RecQ